MPDAYVELPFSIDEASIIDAAVRRLQARWPGWQPNDGDMEVVIFEQGGSFAAAVGYIASQMPPEALRAFGQKLYGVPPQLGTPALTTITLTMIDTAGGYVVPAGAQLNIDGFAFNVVTPVTATAGSATVTGVLVTSAVYTAAANNLTGVVIAQLSLPPYVVDVTVDGPSTSGTDPETPQQYLDRLSRELELRAKTIVTTRDFEIEALDFSLEIGRAQAIGDTARNVTVILATPAGEIVSTPTKTALATHYALFAQINTTYTLIDPTYTTVNVTWTGVALPNFDQAALVTSGNVLLAGQVSPSNFGNPTSGNALAAGGTGSAWLPDSTIYKNDIVAILKGLPGMKHVLNVTLTATGITADGNGNLPLPGVAPLPRPGVMTGSVS